MKTIILMMLVSIVPLHDRDLNRLPWPSLPSLEKRPSNEFKKPYKTKTYVLAGKYLGPADLKGRQFFGIKTEDTVYLDVIETDTQIVWRMYTINVYYGPQEIIDAQEWSWYNVGRRFERIKKEEIFTFNKSSY